MTENYQTAAQSVASAMNAVYENKQTNKKNSISGDFSSDNESYPTVKAVKTEFGTKVDSWSSTNGSTSNYPSEALVKGALNSINSSIETLNSLEVIKVVSTKPTASADTMNKLYIVSESNKVNVYYTTKSGSTYSWKKMDSDILDEFSISWNDIQNKPSFGTGANDFAAGNHTHGRLQNDGQVGSTVQASKPVMTDANGKITTGSFGSSSGTFCEGNDPRLNQLSDTSVNELQYIENIDNLDFTSLWWINGTMISDWDSTANGTLPNITVADSSEPAVLYILSANSSSEINVDPSAAKQIFIYNNHTYVRYKSNYTDVWTNWNKELEVGDVHSEISAFATALAGAINPSS